MNAIGKLYGIVVTILVLFVVPTNWATEKVKDIQREYIENIEDDFVKSVCSKGELTLNMYQVLMEKLSHAGGKSFVKMNISRYVAEPGESIGDVYEYYNDTYTYEILREIEQNGSYKLDYGDSFKMNILCGEDIVVSKYGSVTGVEWR